MTFITTVPHLVKKFSTFKKPEGLLPHSQQPALRQVNPVYAFFLMALFNTIFPPSTGTPNGVFPSGLLTRTLYTHLLTKSLYTHLLSHIRSTCLARFAVFSPRHLDIFRAKYPPQHPILKHTSLCSSPTVAHQISHPNTTAVTSQPLHIIILTFADSIR